MKIKRNSGIYSFLFKRLLDIVISAVVLILASPVFLMVCVVLFVQNKGKIFFFQERPGRHEVPFEIVKFKTMTDARDKHGNLLPDNQRLTKAGAFIRKTSLDELPQLINVLFGHMSLIGPRPLLFKYIPLYNSEQRRRHEVRPGITGWAQVNGRNSIPWRQKFEYDIYYVDHVSFFFDLKILCLTALKVIKREGVNQSEDRPMQPFNGSN